MWLSKNKLRRQGQNDSGRSRGWINQCSSTEMDGRWWVSLHPSGHFSATQPSLTMFSCSRPLDFSYAASLPSHVFLFCVLFSMPVLTSWVVLQNALCAHDSKWLEVACDSQPVMSLPQMSGYCLSVASLTWNARGKIILAPSWRKH